MSEEKINQCKKDIELLQEELKKLEKEQVPHCVNSGQIYEINDREMMVVYIGYSCVGLTRLDNRYPGRWCSLVLSESKESYAELRKVLVDKNAKYVGKFSDLYRRV